MCPPTLRCDLGPSPASGSSPSPTVPSRGLSGLSVPPCGHCWKSSTSLRMTSLNCRGQTMSLQSLAVLDLSTNPLVNGTVLSIAKLPRLENMSKTGLSTLRFDDALPGCKTAMFPALKILSQ
ncbi:unnamed protein product [Oncorhynchus mykiss]|uniref:Uncharacterized protein n=1 Tax=Oncorhynchus mykiss TaxID=8022 RepID=A0A060YCU9_ONCMY|nr:unnamed protein product [Oncorhynchus mykiss]